MYHPAIVIPGFTIGALAVIMMFASFVDSNNCKATTDLMGLTARWGFFEGCMLNINNQWLPWAEVVPVERDGKIVFVPKPYGVVKVQ